MPNPTAKFRRSPAITIRNLLAVLGVFLIALLGACPGEPGGFGSQGDDDTGEDDDDDDSGSTDDDDDTTGADDLNIMEEADPGAEWGCFDACCNEEYMSLSERAEEYSAPITREELRAQLDAIEAGEIPTVVESLEPDELAAQLRGAMNVDFLLDGIDERLLIVRTISEAEHGTYAEYELLFDDDYVGTFHGILLVPEGKEPHPAVVAIHGHEDNAMRYRDEYNAIHLARNGYAVLMLSQRAMDVGPCESDTTVGLLLQGYTFMAMRTYEATLALKYLRFLDSVDDQRIGLIGHSGGAIACNLSVRVVPGFSALVSDLSGRYHSGLWTEEWFALLDETAPSIYPYHELVNDFSTSEAPILSVPYDHATTSHGAEEIVEFFDWSLAP